MLRSLILPSISIAITWHPCVHTVYTKRKCISIDTKVVIIKAFDKPILSLFNQNNTFYFIPCCGNNDNICYNDSVWKDRELLLLPSSTVFRFHFSYSCVFLRKKRQAHKSCDSQKYEIKGMSSKYIKYHSYIFILHLLFKECTIC